MFPAPSSGGLNYVSIKDTVTDHLAELATVTSLLLSQPTYRHYVKVAYPAEVD